LRHPKCVSSLDDLSNNTFNEVIDDDNVKVNEVRRVVFSTGKIYYDLLAKKEEFDTKDIALVRIEQLHPWPEKQIQKIIAKYPNTRRWIWIQEEPENMGAWRYVKDKFHNINIQVVARLASGSPAVGLNKIHILGQDEILGKIFRKCTCELKNKYCGLQCETGSAREDIKKQHVYLNL
jgi:2-oxoglutarate dehydrogenase E1 component